MRKVLLQAKEKMKANGIDADLIEIDFHCTMNVAGWLGDSEPDDAIQKYDIDILLLDPEDCEIKTLIGEARCYYLSDFDEASQQFVNIRDIADADSGDLLVAVTAVTNEEGLILDDYSGEGVLYIDKFYLRPEYRGKGIGQAIFPLILDVLGSKAAVITIIPRPSEDDGNKRIENHDPRYKPILKKMINFIKKYGFVLADQEEQVWVKDTTLNDAL